MPISLMLCSTPRRCGHHGPNQSSVSTTANGDTCRCRVERQPGAVSEPVLTKTGAVLGKEVLARIEAENTVLA